jgi:peptide/nickel transport system substrate-binding protein
VQHVVQQDYYYVTLNTALSQFKDARVRQALSLAIDKKGLIAAVLKGNGQVATGPISPLQKYYYDANVAQYPYDPQKAVALLEQAGYSKHSDGKLYDKSGKPFTINFTAGQYGYLVPASELIQQYWQKIGVTVPFKVLEWNTYIQQVVVKRSYQATFAWWIAPFDPDVYPYFACSAAMVGENISNYCNPALDTLMTQGRKVTDPAARKAVYNKMQQLMATELPLLFLFYPERFTAMSANLHVPAVDYDIAIDNIADWTLS